MEYSWSTGGIALGVWPGIFRNGGRMGITLTSVCFGVARALAVDWVNIVWTEVVWLGYVFCILQIFLSLLFVQNLKKY